MFHRSERLFLRPAWPEDSDAIYRGIADEAVVRNLARAPWPYRPADAAQFAQLPHDASHPRFMVTLPDSGELVGCIGIDPYGDDIEMGYWIARRHWGQGYATEAGQAVIEMARMIGRKRIVASHYADNPASGKVLRKLGFCPTGVAEARMSLGRGEPAEAIGYCLNLDIPESRRAA